MLTGYKTYITAGIAILTAIGLYLSGQDTLPQALQLGFTALMGAFIRNGIATST